MLKTKQRPEITDLCFDYGKFVRESSNIHFKKHISISNFGFHLLLSIDRIQEIMKNLQTVSAIK